MDQIAWTAPDGTVRLTVCVESVELVVQRLIQDGQMLPGTPIIRNPKLPEGKLGNLNLVNGRIVSTPVPTFAQRVEAAKTLDDVKAILREMK